VSLAAIEVAAGPNGNETGAHMVWLILVCDLATVAALSYGWGPRTAVAYLFLTAPLLGFLYTTIDLIAVALAVGAVALVVRGRDRLGGVAFAGVLSPPPHVMSSGKTETTRAASVRREGVIRTGSSRERRLLPQSPETRPEDSDPAPRSQVGHPRRSEPPRPV